MGGCRYDNFTISNNKDFSVRQYFKSVYCGEEKPPDIRLNMPIYMRFTSNGYFQKMGFKFSYQLDSSFNYQKMNVILKQMFPDCGGSINSPSIISSPLLNMTRRVGLYQGFMACRWNITAPKNKIVVMQFEKFDFPVRINCFFDNVDFYDGLDIKMDKRLANLCGNLQQNLPIVKSISNQMTVRLRSDRTVNAEGFTAAVYFADGKKLVVFIGIIGN